MKPLPIQTTSRLPLRLPFLLPFRMRTPGPWRRPLVLAGAAVAALALVPALPLVAEVVAQDASLARQMRHFWHVFAAYAIAWVLVFGWAVAIFRRLGRVEALLREVAPAGVEEPGAPGGAPGGGR